MNCGGGGRALGAFHRSSDEARHQERGKTVVGGGLLLPTFLKPKRGGGKGDGEVPIQWGKGKAARWRFISTASEHGRVNDSGVRCGSAG
jgi:hypothetical protein